MHNETTLVAVQFNKQDRDLLRDVCQKRGETMSSFIRRAVKKELAKLSYYKPETKKALGITPQEEES